MEATSTLSATVNARKPDDAPKSWRDVIKVHPAADLFPMMSETEPRELGEDIRSHGLKNRIVFWGTRLGEESFLLDGRNRLDAMEMVGLATTDLNRTTSTAARGPTPTPTSSARTSIAAT